MYSPFFFVLSSNFELVSTCCRVTFAPSTGFFSASTTLPLIIPVWADAGTAMTARPTTIAQMASVRLTMCVPTISNPPSLLRQKTA